MIRIEKRIQLSLPKESFLFWANQDNTALILDSNHYPNQSKSFDYIVIKGAKKILSLSSSLNAFDQLEEFRKNLNDWIFGYLSYDLKNDTENLVSHNPDLLDFPELLFFQPKKIIFIKDDFATFSYLKEYENELSTDINALKKNTLAPYTKNKPIKLHSRTSKEDYLKNCNTILDKIKLGNLYEANYCIEFYNKNCILSPIHTFIELNGKSKAPFASFFKHNSIHIISNSPERFLKKEGNVLTAQPIKGTRKRGKTENEDLKLITDLEKSIKDRAENTMIVDLVRNDLSKIAQKNSIKVIEYCKIYTFESVHQMISTIQCTVKNEFTLSEIIKHNFPMGSMTGAPKINTMKLIEEIEEHKRGVYSGTIGYISPSNDFDFNVIIRSLLYNSDKKILSLSVGGAITILSDPNEEYQECLVKAHAIRQILDPNYGY